MRKNKFFDTIMIALVIMIAVKVMFPNAFVGSPSENPPFVDLSHMVEIPVYESLNAAADSLLSPAKDMGNYYYGFEPSMASTIVNNLQVFGFFYSTVPKMPIGVSMDDSSVSPDPACVSVGVPAFYVGDRLYYMHYNALPQDTGNYIGIDIDPNEIYLFPFYAGA